jgi:transcriptional regulator with XRE-family HTH domain
MGRRVKRLREAKGMSQRTLAAKAKVTQGLIHQLETGAVQDVRSQVVVKLAKALGVPVTELLG